MSAPLLIPIDFACNDPDNGNFLGKAPMISLGERELIELEANDFERPPRFREEDGHIVLAGKRWPVHSSEDWLGNWCWNRHWVAFNDATAFLAWIHRRDLYSLTCGESVIFEAWDRREPLPLPMLSKLLLEEYGQCKTTSQATSPAKI